MYCNSFIHYKGKDGLTIPEHEDILNRVEELALVDPDTLLPRHCFIFEADFEALGSGPTADCLLWLADMKTAQYWQKQGHLLPMQFITSLVQTHLEYNKNYRDG